MHYFLRNRGMNVKIHHFSVRLCVLSQTTVQQKCGVAFLHSWLGTQECFGRTHRNKQKTLFLIPSLIVQENKLFEYEI